MLLNTVSLKVTSTTWHAFSRVNLILVSTSSTFQAYFSFSLTFSQSFVSQPWLTGALTKVDEKVSVFNRQVSELNKSQDNFSRILTLKPIK